MISYAITIIPGVIRNYERIFRNILLLEKFMMLKYESAI